MEIGHALKVCRTAKGYSLEELAERAKLSQSYLSMIETGNRTPTLSSIDKIAAALEVPTPIILFLAADKDELRGLNADTVQRLSAALLDAVRA